MFLRTLLSYIMTCMKFLVFVAVYSKLILLFYSISTDKLHSFSPAIWNFDIIKFHDKLIYIYIYIRSLCNYFDLMVVIPQSKAWRVSGEYEIFLLTYFLMISHIWVLEVSFSYSAALKCHPLVSFSFLSFLEFRNLWFWSLRNAYPLVLQC